MIKVVNVISDTNIGGAGKCLINFCANYNREKFDVSVVLPQGSELVDKLKRTGVKLIELDGLKDKSWDIKALFSLIKILKNEAPDVVHTHSSITARLAARFIKDCKIVFTRHSVFPVSKWVKNIPGKWIYKIINETLSDRIIAVAEAAKDNLTDGGVAADKIDVILNGVEKINETSIEDREKLKKRLAIKPDEYVIGILARLDKVKGHEYFIDAAKLILDEKKIKAKFLILGTGSEEETLKEKVEALGLSKNIIFTGFVNNVQDYINIFDIQVNCSYGTEATSLALLEGMSIGVPAVVTQYGGNPGVIKNGENGYLVPIKSPRDTADAVVRILTNDELRKYMKKKCIEIYNEKFTVDTYARNVERIYKEMESEPKIKRVNTLDVFIIIIVLLACVFGYMIINNDENVIIPQNKTKIVYQIRTNESLPTTYDMIEENTILYDSAKNFQIGTILKKEALPSERLDIDITSGKFVKTELPTNEFVDILLTVEANADVNEKDINVGGYVVKIGESIYIKGKGYAGTGYIVSIER